MQNEDGECITYTEHLIKLKDQLSEAATANQQAQLKIKHFTSAIKKMESSCKTVGFCADHIAFVMTIGGGHHFVVVRISCQIKLLYR